MLKILDNFLPQEDFEPIQKEVLTTQTQNIIYFSWKSANISYSGVDEITQPPKSSDICYMITTSANICIDEKDYDEARFFMNDDEYNKVTFDFPFAINLFNLILGRFPKINTKLIIDSVVGNLDKKEIYKRIPKELRQHIYSNDKEYNK